MPYDLLIVGADAKANSALANHLATEFAVDTAELALRAVDRLRARRADLAIIESDLPDMSGIALLRLLRDTEFGRDLPVIFLAARKTEQSLAEAFGLGVDDYLARPYVPAEILVRARAVLRRKVDNAEQLGDELTLAGVQIDPGQRRCVVDGKRVTLRPLEFALLEILMRKSGRVLTRAYLLSTIWGMSANANSRSVDAMVSRLRRSLGKRGPDLIQTVSKLGYCFQEGEGL